MCVAFPLHPGFRIGVCVVGAVVKTGLLFAHL